MLVLNPRRVRFGAAVWEEVTAVAVDRSAEREVVEWGDLGPYTIFADVPEQRVTVKVVQEVMRGGIEAPRPGEEGELVFFTSPAATEAGRQRVSVQAVVTDVEHELSLRGGAVRTVTLVGVSADGVTDPVTVTGAETGEQP